MASEGEKMLLVGDQAEDSGRKLLFAKRRKAIVHIVVGITLILFAVVSWSRLPQQASLPSAVEQQRAVIGAAEEVSEGEESEGKSVGEEEEDEEEELEAKPTAKQEARKERSKAHAKEHGGAQSRKDNAAKKKAEEAKKKKAKAKAEEAKKKAEEKKKKEFEKKYGKCAAAGEDCSDKECCKEPGNQCFRKSKFWAECKPECWEGKHLTDPDSTEWSCETIGEKTPGEPSRCSYDGEDCRESKCCEEPGTQCYEKMEYWAMCKPTCTPGPDLTAAESDPWTCKELGPRNPGAGAWVREECAQNGEDCLEKACCAEAGHQCYKKDDWYSTCMPKDSCNPGWKENPWDETTWSCEAVGPVTPRYDNPDEQQVGQVAMWVAEKCSSEGENCMETMCCKSVGWQCYKKNEYWGQCMWQCPPEAAPERRLAGNTTAGRRLGVASADEDSAPAPAPPEDPWDCTPMGPRSWGLAIKGHPSLYCVSLYMPSGYEGGIMNKQLEMDGGIFACDGYDVIASEDVTLGTAKDGTNTLVKTKLIEKIEVGVSQDGTAGNAKLFMAFWDAIIAGKRFRDYDWTIKVDPDAVIIPWRIRDHMRSHVGENVYVVNCNKYPSSPNFPMMYGSIEIFSSAAMIAYADGSWRCGQELDWGGWGEDYYMTHCLDYLGVGRISDFTVVGDNVCTGANCADGSYASFHPFKSPDDWAGCWIQAVPPPAPPPGEEPTAE